MSYHGTVTRLVNVRPHPNADRLVIADALGYQVILSRGMYEEGSLGIVFPEDGRLSHKMLMNNNLYRKHPETGESMGGFFDENGRVKAIKLRGELSNAFFIGLDSLLWATNKLPKEGDKITSIGGELVCEKYFTKATLAAKRMGAVNKVKSLPAWIPRWIVKRVIRSEFLMKLLSRFFVPLELRYPTFQKHFSTAKLRNVVNQVPAGVDLIITEKLHGTSGRTGLVRDNRGKWSYVTGTRNTILDISESSTGFRAAAHNTIINAGLRKGEIVYYELVGYDGKTPIMPPHVVDKKSLREAGLNRSDLNGLETADYAYGCEVGNFDIYIYRITKDGVDLNWETLVKRCRELNIKHVEELYKGTTTDIDLMHMAASFADSHNHRVREGVCLRLEQGGLMKTIVKYKSDLFCILEGIMKNSDNYVDMEEIS